MTIIKKIASEIVANAEEFTKTGLYADNFYHLKDEGNLKAACSSALMSLKERGLIKIACDKRKPFRYGIADIEGLKKFIKTARGSAQSEKYYRALTPQEQHRKECADRLDGAMKGWR